MKYIPKYQKGTQASPINKGPILDPELWVTDPKRVKTPLEILGVSNLSAFPEIKAQQLIEKHEAFRPTKYKPTRKDRWTIGYGLTEKKYLKKGRMTESEASLGVSEYIKKNILPSLTAKPYYKNLSSSQKVALIDLHFNIGQTKFDKSAKLQEALTKGDWQSAMKEMDHGMNNPDTPGLIKRRLEEQELFSDYNPHFRKQKNGGEILKGQRGFLVSKVPTSKFKPIKDMTVSDWEKANAIISGLSTAASLSGFLAPVAVPIRLASGAVGAGIDFYQAQDYFRKGDYKRGTYNLLTGGLDLYAGTGAKYLTNTHSDEVAGLVGATLDIGDLTNFQDIVIGPTKTEPIANTSKGAGHSNPFYPKWKKNLDK